MKRNVVLTIILFLSVIGVRAQLNCTFTHYTRKRPVAEYDNGYDSRQRRIDMVCHMEWH